MNIRRSSLFSTLRYLPLSSSSSISEPSIASVSEPIIYSVCDFTGVFDFGLVDMRALDLVGVLGFVVCFRAGVFIDVIIIGIGDIIPGPPITGGAMV